MAHIQFATTMLNTDEDAETMNDLANEASDKGLASFLVHSGADPVYVNVATYLYMYD